MATPSGPKGERQRWLDAPKNVTRLFYSLVALCVLLLVADLAYEKHPHFAYEGLFGAYAAFGFLAYVGIVFLARGLRRLVKRDEDYYER